MRHLVATVAVAVLTIACVVVPTPARTAVAAAAGRIEVLGATYGFNCKVAKGNATAHVARGCNGKSRCNYKVDFHVLGDQAPGCQKDFNVTWRCSPEGPSRHEKLPPEAGFGSVVTLDCG